MVDRPIKKAERVTKVEPEAMSAETPSEIQTEALEVMPHSEAPSENSEAIAQEATLETEQTAQKTASNTESSHKAPPIKLKDRSEKVLEPSSGADAERNPEKTVVRSPRKSLDKEGRNSEGKGDGFGDRAPGFNPNAKVIDAKERANGRGSDRGDDRGDRNRRNSRNEEPRQVASLAFVRGPKPTKPKAEEPPAELESEIEAELSTDNSLEHPEQPQSDAEA
jgi:hypothetical protein